MAAITPRLSPGGHLTVNAGPQSGTAGATSERRGGWQVYMRPTRSLTRVTSACASTATSDGAGRSTSGLTTNGGSGFFQRRSVWKEDIGFGS